ncbi:hypothetical protein RUND412_008844 [Rhizina undulata]
MTAIHDLHSLQELNELRNIAGARLVVIGTFHNALAATARTKMEYEQTANIMLDIAPQQVFFGRINISQDPPRSITDLQERLRIHHVPHFVFLQGTERIQHAGADLAPVQCALLERLNLNPDLLANFQGQRSN